LLLVIKLFKGINCKTFRVLFLSEQFFKWAGKKYHIPLRGMILRRTQDDSR